MKPNQIRLLFLLTALVNLTGQVLNIPDLLLYSKPLLMPLLLLYVYASSIGNVTDRTLILAIALIFSWGGDLALMSDEFFLLGVGCFFVAQISYIMLFSRSTYSKISFKVMPTLPYLGYTAILLYILIPKAGDLMIPIVVYGLSLLTMASIARLRKGMTSVDSFNMVSIGAILFLVSDSLIAINKFVGELPYGGLAVMTTYIGAQYLIAEGVMRHKG